MCTYDIAYRYTSAVDTNNGVMVIIVDMHIHCNSLASRKYSKIQ